MANFHFILWFFLLEQVPTKSVKVYPNGSQMTQSIIDSELENDSMMNTEQIDQIPDDDDVDMEVLDYMKSQNY